LGFPPAGLIGWLRSGGDEAEDPTGILSKINKLLPARSGQAEEERAKDMENALDWLRAKGVDIEGLPESTSFDTVGFGPSVKSSGLGENSKDIDDALNWLRNMDDITLDPTGIFKQLHASLPKKPGQTLEERAVEITNALNWMRNRGLDPTVDDDESYPKVGFTPIAGSPAGERSSNLEDALNWLRNKDLVEDDTLFDPTGVFKKLNASLPKKTGQSPEERAKDIDNALTWMKQKGLVDDDQDISMPSFDKLDRMDVTAKRSPAERANDMDDALTWLRDEADPSGNLRRLIPCCHKRLARPLKEEPVILRMLSTGCATRALMWTTSMNRCQDLLKSTR